jgi:uncharacterized protein (TIGR03905 family)
MTIYIPKDVCSKEIQFAIENGLVKNVKYVGSCPGSLQAIDILIEGMPIDEVIHKLKGNLCRNGTSCTDQLAKALESYRNDIK